MRRKGSYFDRKRRKRRILYKGLICAVAVGILAFILRGGQEKGITVSGMINAYEEQSFSEADDDSDRKQVSEDDWNLILVNKWNPIPDNYEVTLTQLQGGQSVDSRIYPELQQMFDDARAEGLLPAVSSSYRTQEKQQELLDEKIAEYQAEGYSSEEAKELAEEWVAIPGTSEHQLGIAVDITTADWEQQDASVVWQWLEQNSYKYGFILRYPEEKKKITGVMHEEWHFRYVGKEAAKEIYDQGICLEEYLDER